MVSFFSFFRNTDPHLYPSETQITEFGNNSSSCFLLYMVLARLHFNVYFPLFVFTLWFLCHVHVLTNKKSKHNYFINQSSMLPCIYLSIYLLIHTFKNCLIKNQHLLPMGLTVICIRKPVYLFPYSRSLSGREILLQFLVAVMTTYWEQTFVGVCFTFQRAS